MSLLVPLLVLGLSLGILLAGWASPSWIWGLLAALIFVFMITVFGKRGRGAVAVGLVALGAGAVGIVDGAVLRAPAHPRCSVG
ncbi:MAG: hypothetical protein KAI47_20315, partial [Deltaproteobacteria bacterium]|nr:hypothetical protein [Deltaproteobacteria bacterium]